MGSFWAPGDAQMKRIAILGSTGSIGRSALAVVAAHPDRLRVVGLAAGGNVDRFAAQVAAVRPQVISLAGREALDRLRASGPSRTESRRVAATTG